MFLRASSRGPISEEALRQPLATVAESDVERRTDCIAAWREEAHPGPYSQSLLTCRQEGLPVKAILQARLAGACLGS